MASGKSKKSQPELRQNDGDMEEAINPIETIEESAAESISEEQDLDVHVDCRKQLDEARIQASEYLDGWQRARADFANYKKRVERDQAQAHQTAAGNILKRYLAIVDDLERALRNKPAEGDGALWAEGVDLVYRKMLALLESEGVKPMLAEGQQFDPNLHEAILMEDSDLYESGQITEVLQQGYLLGDKVLRPAMVRVAR